MERCFKLHGYPNKNKGTYPKKFAAATTHTDDNINGKDFGLSSEQFTNLLSYIGKQTHKQPLHIDDTNDDEYPANAHVAGKTFFLSGFNGTQWIVDSGATDHMCGDLTCFFNLKNVSNNKQEIIKPDGSKHKVTKMCDIQLNQDLILKNFYMFLYFISI